MLDLHGKHVVVTGASSGIGRAVAVALAKEGARVALLARRQDVLDGIASEIEAAGGQAFALSAEVRLPNASSHAEVSAR